MVISKEWLSEFVDLGGRRDEDIAREFTLRVAEVEGMVREADAFQHMVLGAIVAVAPHPNADRLCVVSVDAGEHVPVQVVCGGSNVVVGQKIALARVGARVQWHGAGELVTLEPTEIRGVKSDGMICGADEIGLAAEFPKGGEKEILDLSSLSSRAGTPLAEALGKNGVLFELDNKALSNRPDLWGVRGLAREFGAVLGAKINLPAPRAIKTKSDISLEVKVADAELCPRYEAVVMAGVDGAAPSPVWMQKRLVAAGVRPVSAIVDVTNFVMLEGGQPLHAFDFDLVKVDDRRASIFVRGAQPGEKIATLDGKTHELPSGALVVATKTDAIAVAGVIGGAMHSIGDATRTIVIESANFSAGSVRRTSSALHVRTESSSRFEKGLDPNNTEWGLARAIELLCEIFPAARVVSTVVDVKRSLPKLRVIDFSQEDMDRALGVGVKLSVAKKILEQLGFVCKGDAKKIRVTVPAFRLKDMGGVHDLVEEVARIYGYENIASTLPAIQIHDIKEDAVVAMQFKIKTLCAYRQGLIEVNTYAYVRPHVAALFGIAPNNLIELANPLSSERPFLASTLAMNLAEVVEKNQRTCAEVAVFEIAKVFERAAPSQSTHLAIALGGKSSGAENAFGRARDAMVRVCTELGYAIEVRAPDDYMPWWQGGAAAELLCEGTTVGYVARVDASVRGKMGIEHDVVIAEIDLTKLLSGAAAAPVYRPTSAYQLSVRDVAVVVAEKISAHQLLDAARGSHPLVRGAEVFDIFRGAAIGDDKKAVAVHVVYGADDHTLSGEELDAAHRAVTGALEKKCGAVVR